MQHFLIFLEKRVAFLEKSLQNDVANFSEIFLLMAKSDVIEVEGIVLECLPSGFFRVKITHENWPAEHAEIIASASGKMRKHSIRVLPGDNVKIELSPYDLSRGRITYREK